MLTCATALPGSFLPLSTVLMSEPIFEGPVERSKKLGMFGHGVIYAAYLVCAAVVNELVKIYQERDIVGHIRRVAPRLQAGLWQLAADYPLLGHTRRVGLLGAVEHSRDKAAAGAFNPKIQAGALVQQLAYERGLIVRGMRGDRIAIGPTLIITEAKIDELLSLQDSLDAAALELRRRGAWAGA